MKNRERKTQQKFKRTSGIKISKRPYYLYEVADYVSVYSVKPYAIGFIEALLIHSFPNDLTNVRVEKNGKLKFEDKIEKKKVEKKRKSKNINLYFHVLHSRWYILFQGSIQD